MSGIFETAGEAIGRTLRTGTGGSVGADTGLLVGGSLMGQIVYILYHVHEFKDIYREDDVKLIGVYENLSDAEAAQGRASKLEGFRDNLNEFQIHPYQIGKDHWTEGFSTVYHTTD